MKQYNDLYFNSNDFTIENDLFRVGEGDLAPTITSPSGEKVEPKVKDNGDGTYTVGYTPTEDGPHKVDVKYDGDSIPGTPKEVEVLPKTDTGKVKAYGPGLESALTGQKAQFTVDTREAGMVTVMMIMVMYSDVINDNDKQINDKLSTLMRLLLFF